MIRVLIVDDHSFLRAQLTFVLCAADGIEVVGECADGDQVLRVAAAVRPDVVLMDVRMGATSGIAATRALLAVQPTIRVVMLSASGTRAVQRESALAGAAGYLHKQGDSEMVVKAVRRVANGETCWPDDQI
jgi:DNA-binding NarL/FixJ family response regulator